MKLFGSTHTGTSSDTSGTPSAKADNVTGTCFCGAVEIEVTGAPMAMGYCHCADCRSWSASPVNAFTLWAPDRVAITRGAEHVAAYHKSENTIRKWCKRCGGHLMADHPGLGAIDVYAATIAGVPFKPALHVHYRETVMPMRDGLPKQRDMPAEMGGSGILIDE